MDETSVYSFVLLGLLIFAIFFVVFTIVMVSRCELPSSISAPLRNRAVRREHVSDIQLRTFWPSAPAPVPQPDNLDVGCIKRAPSEIKDSNYENSRPSRDRDTTLQRPSPAFLANTFLTPGYDDQPTPAVSTKAWGTAGRVSPIGFAGMNMTSHRA
ncbi:uncharacterized protein MCYG_02057 [Microsporum canis CBS 113480]|uniref:Uncharacterized protein n=1 Tax=Arthroderma otae (strain ATCC MYA-4605 / CBS 113480) TaxID=554155 RepID=C5FIG9_ARTOC|nr:uncharacterized protein MCYG_02057 [Microsporum canis CBS 113480]EEQ29238.1 predicted protein [Microsporum canis CBS 113480]